jgi:poly(glycerol-phosphate) alpha-glucosyltransferase
MAAMGLACNGYVHEKKDPPAAGRPAAANQGAMRKSRPTCLPMRSAFVTSSVSRDAGGLFFAMTSMAKCLHQAGVDLSVHGIQDSHSLQDAHAWDTVPCFAHARRGPAAIAYAPHLGSALAAGEFDLMHTHGIWQAPSAAVHRWHEATHKPYLISPHGMLDPWALEQSRRKKRIVSVLYEFAHLRDAACIHALCPSEAESIRAYGLKNPVCIIPNGVELPEEARSQNALAACSGTGKGEACMAWPERSGGKSEVRDQRKTLLFLGRIHPKKGLVPALRAWAEIRGRRSEVGGQEEWQFVIAGWDQGGHRAELEQLCREIGVSVASVSVEEFLASQNHLAPLGKSATVIDTPLHPPNLSISEYPNVLFLGPAFGEQKDALLRRADAFILPSFSEGLPMSVLEAWSYRLPVLMTEHCNLPEGFAAEAAIRIGTDAESIAEGLHSLLASRVSDLTAMGRNGRALVERQFTWPQVAAQMKEVYEWILGGGEVPDCVRD